MRVSGLGFRAYPSPNSSRTSYELQSTLLKGRNRGLYRGILQELSRGILGVKIIAHMR